jgi:hypothetical protein
VYFVVQKILKMNFTSLDFETANPSRVSICAAGLAGKSKSTKSKIGRATLLRSHAFSSRTNPGSAGALPYHGVCFTMRIGRARLRRAVTRFLGTMFGDILFLCSAVKTGACFDP